MHWKKRRPSQPRTARTCHRIRRRRIPSPCILWCRTQAACHAGARRRLSEILTERLSRLDELAKKVAQSLALDLPNPVEEEHRSFVEQWPGLKAALATLLAERETVTVPDPVRAIVEALPTESYLHAVQTLAPEAALTLTAWLAACPSTVAALQKS